MKFPRRTFLHLAGGAVALPAVSRLAWGQAYPSRPVRIFVGYPPGGAADTIVRIVARWLTDRLGQQFIVENRPGAATNVSIQAAMVAPPDGHALVYVGTTVAINAALYESYSINFFRDGSAVAGLVRFPHVVTANP